ncbi:MAG: metallophosphoesterase [Alphaproteobacteria bacterium]
MVTENNHFQSAPGEVPAGVRVWVVGDIHGRDDLLERCLWRIADDGQGFTGRRIIVFLGDYVDRGPMGSAVLERIADDLPPGFESVTLLGNHEWMMLRFLGNFRYGSTWFLNGGLETLRSYGVELHDTADRSACLLAQDTLVRILPRHHRDFLAGLVPSHVLGSYRFVHAGLRPGVPFARQSLDDLLWIREPFLMSEADFGCIVVHGHTISLVPEIRANRIGIDTGAYQTDRLTTLVLEGRGLRFLST